MFFRLGLTFALTTALALTLIYRLILLPARLQRSAGSRRLVYVFWKRALWNTVREVRELWRDAARRRRA